MSASLTKLVPPAPPIAPAYRLLTPKTSPVPLLATSAARIYNHAHAPLVLAYYVLRFSFLVANPFQTMVRDLVPLVIAQSAFCVTCLPSAGTWGSGGSAIISSTASGKSGKTGSGLSPGSMRRKAGKAGLGGLSTVSPVGPVSWKSKVMVSRHWPLIVVFLAVRNANQVVYSPQSFRSSSHSLYLRSHSPSLH